MLLDDLAAMTILTDQTYIITRKCHSRATKIKYFGFSRRKLQDSDLYETKFLGDNGETWIVGGEKYKKILKYKEPLQCNLAADRHTKWSRYDYPDYEYYKKALGRWRWTWWRKRIYR